MHDPYRALYVHLPFCVKRCAYCDFTTAAVKQDSPLIDEYIEELCLQIRRKAREGELGSIETVYLGGGTPSHVGLSRLSMLLYTLSLSMRLEPDVECTMEANPESLTPAMVRDIWALGVNRLSIGVQSFDDNVLATLGRAHNAEGAKRAVAAAHERFDNVSVDLMCGIPGQTTASLEHSVQTAIEQGVTHMSIYPLTIEPHTPFDAMVLSGQMEEPDDDVEAEHMQVAARLLQAAGYQRYEVASYAKPGYACKHNIAYWTGVPYLGIGKSAASMTQNDQRRMRVQDGQVTDDLNRAEMFAEDLMLGMRMSRGVSDELVTQAESQLPDVQRVLEELARQGLAAHEGNRWRPSADGCAATTCMALCLSWLRNHVSGHAGAFDFAILTIRCSISTPPAGLLI